MMNAHNRSTDGALSDAECEAIAQRVSREHPDAGDQEYAWLCIRAGYARAADREPSGDERDAARYRFVRQFLVTAEHLTGEHAGKLALSGDNEGLDEIIDSALGAAKREGE